MRYQLDADRSTVLIQARSSMGDIEWESQSLQGQVDLLIHEQVLEDPPPTGEVTVDLSSLTSGNTVYDSELLRRIEARRHPFATVGLTSIAGSEHPLYQLAGTLTFHGVTRPLSGQMELRRRDDGTVLVVGEQVIDIRDFDVPAPAMLMLKIYPDVTVHLIAVLSPVAGDPAAG